jgi:hypothetical protein
VYSPSLFPPATLCSFLSWPYIWIIPERFREFLEGKSGSIETEVIARDGKRVPVSINATPIEFWGRRYLVGIFHDITWQKEVQKVIAEGTEEVDRFFTTSLDLFCIADTYAISAASIQSGRRFLDGRLLILRGNSSSIMFTLMTCSPPSMRCRNLKARMR